MTEANVTAGSDRAAVVTLTGDVDYSNVRRVSHDLRSALPDSAVGVVVDLSGVEYLDSSGLHMLFELHRTLHGEHREVVLVVPESSPLRRLFKITGLDEVVGITTDTASALALVTPTEPAE